MASRRTPKYRLHKASGLAVVTINRRDHYLGTYGTKHSKLAYDRLIKEWDSTGQSASFGISTGATIAMLISDYLDHCEIYYPRSPNSETNQSRLALKYLEPYFDQPAEEFGPLKLKAVRETMISSTTKATGKPFSRQYVNRLIDRICRMFRWASENEIVPIQIHQSLINVPGLKKGRSKAREAPPVRPVADEIVERTLPFCSPIIRDMIRLQQLTGMRPGEVCVLRASMIRQSGEIWVVEFDSHKTAWRGKERYVYLGPQAQEILSRYDEREPETHIFSPEESQAWRNAQRSFNRTTPMNCGNRPGYSSRTRDRRKAIRKPGHSYTTASYARAIRYACQKAMPVPEGCTKDEAIQWRQEWWWSPNQLRHAAATRFRSEHGLEAAQVLLGHSNADVTQIYAEANREKARAIAAAVG